MTGIFEMWDGWSLPEETSEQKLDALLKSNNKKSPKGPNRAFNYLVNNWEEIHNYSKKFIFYYRHDAILKLLARHFDNFEQAPIKLFLIKKCIFSFSLYSIVYLFLTAVVAFYTFPLGMDSPYTACLAAMVTLYCLAWMIRDA